MKHIIILGDGMADHPSPDLEAKPFFNMPTSLIWICSHAKGVQVD